MTAKRTTTTETIDDPIEKSRANGLFTAGIDRFELNRHSKMSFLVIFFEHINCNNGY